MPSPFASRSHSRSSSAAHEGPSKRQRVSLATLVRGGLSLSFSAVDSPLSCASETVTQVQDAVETPGQAAAAMPGRAVVETPAKPTICLRCSKQWATPCTRESEYRKCKRCADKKKPCVPIPKAFWARFINVDKLCGEANLSDDPILTDAAQARLVQYVRDVEAYGRKSDSLPKSSSRRAALVPAPRDSTVSLQLEVRGLRQDLRALAGVWLQDRNPLLPLDDNNDNEEFHAGAVLPH